MMDTVLLLHRGGNIVRGSEQALIDTAIALRNSGMRLVLARNDPCMDRALVNVVDTIVDFEYPEIMLAGRSTRLPLIRYVRQLVRLLGLIRQYSVTLVLANGGLPCQLAVPATRLTRVPLLCEFYHPATRRYLYLWLLRWADRLVFPSKFTQVLMRTRAGLDGVVIPLGVDIDTFAPAPTRDTALRQSLGIPDDAVVFGQVAALQPHKRQALLISALAKAGSAAAGSMLLIVGSGPDRERLEAHAQQLGVAQRVRFTGYVESVLPYYQHVIDVNVLASAEEGLGIAILEGAAVGLPALIADASGLRETVLPGRTGLTFPVDDEDALAKCITELSDDPAQRQSLGQEGRRFVAERFSVDVYRQQIVSLVREQLTDAPVG